VQSLLWKEVLFGWASVLALPAATLAAIAALYWCHKRTAQHEPSEPYDYSDHSAGKDL
jgi:hypothetical protein